MWTQNLVKRMGWLLKENWYSRILNLYAVVVTLLLEAEMTTECGQDQMCLDEKNWENFAIFNLYILGSVFYRLVPQVISVFYFGIHICMMYCYTLHGVIRVEQFLDRITEQTKEYYSVENCRRPHANEGCEAITG